MKHLERLLTRLALLLTVLLGNSSCMLTYDPNSPPLPKAASASHAISGSITGSLTTGITLQLSGAATSSTVTDASGHYSFSGLSNGSYTLTPTASGYTFSPGTLAMTVSGSDVTGQDFTDLANADPVHVISGRIAGPLVSGVTIQLTGTASSSTTTDASGHYSFSGLKNGNYTITPTASGYTFTPSSTAVTVNGSDVTDQNFTDTANAAPKHIVSGTVSGTAFTGVSLTISGAASASVFTDSAGGYSFTLQDGSYTVTPSAAGRVFTPASRSVVVNGAAISGQDFRSDLQLLLDPEFQNTPEGAWTLAGGAVINPGAAGLLQPGNLVFSMDAMCAHHAAATQIIATPSFADVGPLALNVTYSGSCSLGGNPTYRGPCTPEPALFINLNHIPLDPSDTMVNERRCLGELAYGSTIAIKVGAPSYPICSAVSLGLNVDRVKIEQDQSCPPIRTIPNADFESSTNWTFLNGGIQGGLGVGGSRAGHLMDSSSLDCLLNDADHATGAASLPLGAGASIQVSIAGTPARSLSVGEAESTIDWATFAGAGGFRAVSVCIPEYAKGMVEALRLSLPCKHKAADFYVDNISFTTNSACPADASIIDGGFELSDSSLSYWSLGTSNTGPEAATIMSGASAAHSGSRYLLLSAASGGGVSALALAAVTISPSRTTGGPALKYYYRYPTKSGTQLNVRLGSVTDSPPQQATYTQRTVCLKPGDAGGADQVAFELVSWTASGIESVYVDDVSVGTDPSCPTQ